MNNTNTNNTKTETAEEIREAKIKEVFKLVSELYDPETGFSPLVVLSGHTNLTFNFKKSNYSFSARVGDLPQDSVEAILTYGTRKGNDRINSRFGKDANGKVIQEDTTENRMKEIQAFKTALFNGTLDKRDTDDKEFKAYIKEICKTAGFADKALSGQNVVGLIGLILKKKGIENTSETVKKAYENLYAKYEQAKAAKANALDSFNI